MDGLVHGSDTLDNQRQHKRPCEHWSSPNCDNHRILLDIYLNNSQICQTYLDEAESIFLLCLLDKPMDQPISESCFFLNKVFTSLFQITQFQFPVGAFRLNYPSW